MAMDPLTLITGALISGAAAALKSNAEQALKDAYVGLKALIKKKWEKADVEVIERDPASSSRQALLKESLGETPAAQDREIVEAARALLQTLEKRDPTAVAAAGLDIDQIRSLGDMSIDAIMATPGGTRIGTIESQGNMKLGNLGGWGERPNPRSR